MEDVAQILQQEFLKRQKQISTYSLRTFARELKLKPSHLCKVFTGEKGISKDSAVRIGFTIGLPPLARRRFELLSAAQFGRSCAERNLAKQGLRGLPYMQKAKKELEEHLDSEILRR